MCRGTSRSLIRQRSELDVELKIYRMTYSGSEEEDLVRNVLCTEQNAAEGHSREDVGIVALTWLEQLPVHLHILKRTPTCKQNCSLNNKIILFLGSRRL